MSVDYYKLLEIPRTASLRQVKTSYKKFALQYHPDKNSSVDAEEKFREIQKAYEILSDSTQRQIYDENPSTYGNSNFDLNETKFYQNIVQETEQKEYLRRRQELSAEYEKKIQEHKGRSTNPDLIGTSFYYRKEKEFSLLEIEFLELEKFHFEREMAHSQTARMKQTNYHGMPIDYHQKKIDRLEIKIKKFQALAQQYQEQEREQAEKEGVKLTTRGNSFESDEDTGRFPALVRRAMAALFERHL